MCKSHILIDFILISCLQLILIIGFTNSYSQIWGRVHPLAVAIYEVDLELSRNTLKELEDAEQSKEAFVDILYPSLGATNNYIITMMLVLDGRKKRSKLVNELENDRAEAFILSGGIGLNYTRVRFMVHDSDMNFNFIIYGIHPQAYDI